VACERLAAVIGDSPVGSGCDIHATGEPPMTGDMVPAPHRTKLHSTNPIERLNGEIKRRTGVVGIFEELTSV